MTPLTFTLTRPMLVAAARAFNRRKWPRFVIVYALCSFAFGVILDMFYDGAAGWMLGAGLAGLALATSLILFLIVQFWSIPRRVNSALRNFDDDALEQHVDWDEDNFHIVTGEGESRVRMKRLAGWTNAAEALLIYRTDNQYYILPDRSFDNPSQRADLVASLEGAGVRRR